MSKHNDPELEKWLPTLERAQAEGPLMVHRGWFRGEVDVWSLPVAKVETVAGIALRGRMARREYWRKVEEVSEGRYAQVRAAITPVEGDFVPRSYARIILGGERARCTQCHPNKPGQILCVRCDGRGSLHNEHDVYVGGCPWCVDGFVNCSTCNGTASAISATFEYIDDKVESFSSLILPDVPPKLSWWLHSELSAQAQLPECLLFRLDQMFQMAPYRGASVSFEPDFHGFRFGGAFDRSREGLHAIVDRADVLKYEYQSYARAVMVVHFGEGEEPDFHAVFVVSDDGLLRGFAAKPEKQGMF